MNKEYLKRNVLYVGLILLHLLVMGLLCSQKADFHMDEIATFALANDVGENFPSLEHGMEYKGWGPYYGGIVVNEGEAFDYKCVWKNQTEDVHPVLYYILIHTICSIFSSRFSMWFGIIVNLCCLIIIDILLFQISKIIFESDIFALSMTAFYGTSYLLVNMMSFIRMYSLLMVFVLLISRIFLEYFDKQKDIRFYVVTFLTVLGGMLTQYFFVIYLFFLCVFMGVKMLFVDKNIKATLGTGSVVLLGMAVSALIFPGMLKHIFIGHRGKESVQNLVSVDDFLPRIREYGQIVNKELIGGLLLVVLLVWGVWFAFAIKGKQKFFSARIMLFISAWLYFVVVAKISPCVHDRYISPVCPIIVICLIYPIYKLIKMFGKERYSAILVVLLLAINFFCLNSFGWATAEMYKNSEAMQIAKNNSDKLALCIGDTRWRNLYSANQLRNYKGYYFADSSDYDDVVEKINDELVVYVEGDLNYGEIETALREHGVVSCIGYNLDTQICLFTPYQ